METFFLGIIAFSMLFIAILALVRTIVWITVLFRLKKLLELLYLDYRHISPKIFVILDNMSSITSVFGLLKLIRRRKSEK